MDSIWVDMRIDVVYYRWWDSRHQAIILDKLRVGIPSDFDRYAYAINVEANNKAFLEYLPTLMDKGWKYIENELAGMMASYVKAMANKGYDNTYKRKYYNDWLTNTEILCKNEPSILRWCDEYRRFLDGDDSIFFDEPIAIKKLREGDQATETKTVTVPKPPTANEPPTPQPDTKITKDELKTFLSPFFKSRFKGLNGSGVDNLDSVVEKLWVDIQTEKSIRWICRVAYLVYECPEVNKRQLPTSFKGWLQLFCDKVGYEVPKETGKNKYKTIEPKENDEVRERYIILT